jgi:hypothetical protein
MEDSESDKVPADIERLERKIDEAIRRLDQECEELSKAASENQTPLESVRCHGNLFWGGFFLIAGLIWLGSSMGWFKLSIPWGPVILILFGLVLLYRRRG